MIFSASNECEIDVLDLLVMWMNIKLGVKAFRQMKELKSRAEFGDLKTAHNGFQWLRRLGLTLGILD